MKKANSNTQLRDAFSLPHNRAPRVLIWGLGVHGGGEGMVRFFAELGWHIVIHDPKPKSHFRESIARISQTPHITWKLGVAWSDRLLHAIDLIIKNPGVPLTHTGLASAQRLHIPVTSDADIFTRLITRDRIIGVTGTKGKTTTTTLIAHMLGKKDAVAVGIPGVPFLAALTTRKKYIIAEYSSFDCDLLTESPHIAVCTSLFPDHLNRYPNFASYAKAKGHLWEKQSAKDILVLGSTVPKKFITRGNGKRVVASALSTRTILPYTVHPESASIALAVARACGVPQASALARLKTYHGQEGRREYVPHAKLLSAYNDTTATNPGSATSSILALKEHFPHSTRAVIVGGEDKAFPDADLRALAQALRTTTVTYLIPGSFSDRLAPLISKHVNLVRAPTLRDAVRAAERDFPKCTLLLSPGGASFNHYAHEFERGRDFVSAVTHRAHGKISRRS